MSELLKGASADCKRTGCQFSELHARVAKLEAGEAMTNEDRARERFRDLVRDCVHGDYDGQNGTAAAVDRGNAILAAVRAEATLAEREACALSVEKDADIFEKNLLKDVARLLRGHAAAIRARSAP